jgi:4-hydroxyphenylpyruvate dioxygenase-like putative hemolysin
MEKKQTAVEWLIDQMLKQGYFDGNKPLSITNLDHLEHQAKLMELEQIVKAYRTIPTARWTNTFAIRYFNKHYGYNYTDNILDSNTSNV